MVRMAGMALHQNRLDIGKLPGDNCAFNVKAVSATHESPLLTRSQGAGGEETIMTCMIGDLEKS